MDDHLPTLIQIAGGMQLCILVASALVPFRLDWKHSLDSLPKLHQQLYWVYGGYVVLGIVSLGLICLINPTELASGTLLARSVCTYIAAFWGIRLSLQTILDAKSFLTTWWLVAGYHLLTVLFTLLTLTFAWAAVHPA
jgi:hypothetical protein